MRGRGEHLPRPTRAASPEPALRAHAAEQATDPGLTFTRVTPNSLPTGISLGEEIVKTAPVVGWTGRYVTYDGSVEDANRKAIDAISTSDIVTVDGMPPPPSRHPSRPPRPRASC